MPVPNFKLVDFWVDPQKLLLWPNNPRLKISTFDDVNYTVQQLTSPEVQDKLLDLMLNKENDVQEIIDSIQSQGYLNMNSIIVKRVGDQFMVLEGNRRTSAIKYWHQNIDELGLEQAGTISEIPAKKFICDDEDDLLQIYQLLAQMHIAGPKSWTPIQQAHMVYKTYIGLLNKVHDQDKFIHDTKLTKECAKILSQSWQEVRRDLAIYRIFRQLQLSRYTVQHEHYSKIQMAYESSALVKDYLGFDSDLYKMDQQGLERFNELFITDNCAIKNPQDFKKLKYIYKELGTDSMEHLRTDSTALQELYERAKDKSDANKFVNSLKKAFRILSSIPVAEYSGTKEEEKLIDQIKLLSERFNSLVGGGLALNISVESVHAIPVSEKEAAFEDVLNEDDNRDPRYDEDYYTKDFMLSDLLNVGVGDRIQIDMISEEIDSFLWVLDGANSEEVASDDDSGGGLNAQIIFNIQRDVHYQIRATTANPEETGKFKLHLKKLEGAEPALESTETAVNIVSVPARHGDIEIPDNAFKGDSDRLELDPATGHIRFLKFETGEAIPPPVQFKISNHQLQIDSTYIISIKSDSFKPILGVQDCTTGEKNFYVSDGQWNIEYKFIHEKETNYIITVFCEDKEKAGPFRIRLHSD